MTHGAQTVEEQGQYKPLNPELRGRAPMMWPKLSVLQGYQLIATRSHAQAVHASDSQQTVAAFVLRTRHPQISPGIPVVSMRNRTHG